LRRALPSPRLEPRCASTTSTSDLHRRLQDPADHRLCPIEWRVRVSVDQLPYQRTI
jgi:hypothetical protein